MRLFIGIEIPDSLRHSLSELQFRLKERGIQASWKYIGNLHLTLEFLGEIESEKVPVLAAILTNSLQGKRSFSLSIGGIDAFPSLQRPKNLWTSVRGDVDLLQQIREDIHAQLVFHNFQVEDRKFMPHITLASRLKGTTFDLSGIAPGLIGEFTVKNIILFDSREEHGKRIYSALEKASLQ